MRIYPSILNANFSCLSAELSSLQSADKIHLDIMDGAFVPAISFGSGVMKHVDFLLPFDVHLMVHNPKKYIDKWVELGSSTIIIHAENTDISDLQYIKKKQVRAGVVIDLTTEIQQVSEEMLEFADAVLIMTVKAGAGGQKFQDSALEKVRYIREKYPNKEIIVDGGVNDKTLQKCADAGATGAVVGSYLTNAPTSKRAEMIAALQNT